MYWHEVIEANWKEGKMEMKIDLKIYQKKVEEGKIWVDLP